MSTCEQDQTLGTAIILTGLRPVICWRLECVPATSGAAEYVSAPTSYFKLYL